MREAASSIAPSGRTTRPEASPKQPADRGVSPVTRTRDAGDAARRAEPRGIGSAGARDPLAREVKLLGALLGQVIVEQEGPELFELVEQLRRAAIRGRRSGPEETIEGALHALDGRPATDLLAVARAFTAYFLLINLAEEKHRLRTLRKRERSSRRAPLADGIGAAILRLRRDGMSRDDVRALAHRMRLMPVLTAHPTEARRRTVLVAQRRLYRLLDRFDDPRLTRSEDRDLRRRLREQISLLWQTSPVRAQRPTPLDEVRAAMVFFDETLFAVTPRLYRALQDTIGGTDTDAVAEPYLRWGSWIGSDRDGHPGVTAEVTRRTIRIQADHILRGYRNVLERLQQTIAISDDQAGLPAEYRRQVAQMGRPFPRVRADLERRYGGQSYRQALGIIGERIDRTRARLVGGPGIRRGGYESPAGAADGPAPDAGLASPTRSRSGGCRRGPGSRLAGRDLRIPPRLAGGSPARRRTHGRAGAPPFGWIGRRAGRRVGRHAQRGPRHVADAAGDRPALRLRCLAPLRHQLHPHAR